MSRKYKFGDSRKPYFVSFATVGMLEMTAWINDALKEQKATGKFYYWGQYSFDALYLTPEQHSFLGKYITLQD